ncbi:MAG: DNA-directed RNA polymerase subunit omega [Deltaproteobacteria bacterium]|nr:DNA-directed RNA polymerase subunit omega [Deltaproteobacteria bacterium]
MARITIEDCLKRINNRFALIHMASKRVRELRKGEESTIISKNRDIVVALREIAAGNIEISESGRDRHLSERPLQIQPESRDQAYAESSGQEPDSVSTGAEGN